MKNWQVRTSCHLSGITKVPSSKSQSLRAILFASLAQGPSLLYSVLDSPDTQAMITACTKFGARFEKILDDAKVKHNELLNYQVLPIKSFQENNQPLLIDAGNSGITWRFIAAIAALRPGVTLITGDRSILERRPIEPLLAILRSVGVQAYQTQNNSIDHSKNGFTTKGPCIIKGPFKISSKLLQMDGYDSQPVSAFLIAACLQPKPFKLDVLRPQEIEWVKLTLQWLSKRGVGFQAHREGSFYKIKPQKSAGWSGSSYQVPGDFSSASFLIAAAIVTRSTLTLHGLDFEDLQPDKQLIELLKQTSGLITEENETGALESSSQQQLTTLTIHGHVIVNAFEMNLSGPIDLLPILSVVACFAKGPCTLFNIEGAQFKESNRVEAISLELRKMGAKIEHQQGIMKIHPSLLHSSIQLYSHHDHRIAMSLAVAALGAKGESVIHEVECAAKTYKNFLKDLSSLGAKIKEKLDENIKDEINIHHE